jgi:PAS domain S-box-containing protein
MDKGHYQILLVEDNPADAIFIRDALDQDPLAVFDLYVVECLADARKVLAKRGFDAALLDLGLPDSLGLATFHNLHQAAPDLPVVVFSALDNEEVAQQAVQGGAQDYLVKNPQEIAFTGRAVRYAIERRKNEQQFNQVAATVPGAITLLCLRPGGKMELQYVSQSFADVFGLPPDLLSENIGSIIQRIPPAEVQNILATLKELTLALKPVHFDFTYRHPTKGDVWLENRAHPVKGLDDSVVWYGVTNDITERKLGESALRESENRFVALFRSNPVPIGITHKETYRIVDVNDAWSQLTGYSRTEAIGFTSTELGLASPDTLNRVRALVEENGLVRQFEIPLIKRSGEERRVQISSEPLKIDGENLILNNLVDITERKQAEDALVDSERRLRMALETTSDGFWIVDANRHFKEVNPAYCAISGYTRDEFTQLSIQDIEVLEDNETTQARIRKIQRDGRDLFETKHRRKDGSVFDVEVSVNLLDPDTGLMICFCRDITDRKTAEKEAAYRQDLLEKVIQLGKKIAGKTDLEDCLREIYHGARFGLGFDRIGLFLYDEALHRVQGVYGTGRSGEIETPGLTAEPIEQWFGWEKAMQDPMGFSFTEDYQKVCAVPETDDMFGVGQHVMVTAWAGNAKPVALIAADNLLTGKKITPTDIEALQLFAGYAGLAIENARLHTNLEKKVQERTAQVQDLYDNAPTGYHSLDENGCILQINQTELNWMGYTREELIGRRFSDFFTPESFETFKRNFPEFKRRGWVRDLEFEIIRKDGTTFHVLVNATAVKDRDGALLMSRSTLLDITERRKAEQALRESEAQLRASRDRLSETNAALEKAARVKDEFLASMSHELRTPLTGILGISEGLKEQVYGPLNERQIKAIANIEGSGRHLLDLINDILDVSKLEAGMLNLQIETCALGQICQASLYLVRGMVHAKNQKLTFAMNPAALYFQADQRRFKQILVNLLSNAVKYSPAGGSLGLEVEGSEEDHTIRIAVWDHGIGIKPEDRDKLFQPFVQIDSSLSRLQTGTGLGLTLVKHLVDLHGGSLDVESTFGEGSRFTISMPWDPHDAPAVASPADENKEAARPAAEGAEKGSGTAPEQVQQSVDSPAEPLVLLVDDNEITRTTIKDYLCAWQLRVAPLRDAYEFLDQLANLLPDLVLMDIQMPGMDGLEAIRRIRAHQNPRVAKVPVIALTALAMPGDRDRCLAAGATEYLSKPVNLHNLAVLIHTLVDKKVQ